jgi:hypothetical protein
MIGEVEPPSGSFLRSMGYPEWNGMEWNELLLLGVFCPFYGGCSIVLDI